MGWRSLLISQACYLSIKNRQLVVEQKPKSPVSIALEDICVIVLETPTALVTSALLSEIANYQIALITCDQTHHPNGLLLPYLPHSRTLRVMEKQLKMTQPQKKKAWQAIIQQKLTNQALTLETCDKGKGRFLLELSKQVSSGDSGHCESQGARYYFAKLLGNGFTRDQDGWINSALNYGYAILRAALARSLVSYGFLTAFGLHHKNQLNTFNLADDLIEPLRPLVDHWTVHHPPHKEKALNCACKTQLIQLLYQDIVMPKGKMSVLAAIDQMVESLGRLIDTNDIKSLELPTLFAGLS